MRKWPFVLTAFAGLAGVTGMILAGLAAHGSAGPFLDTAANYLLLHAVAIAAVAAVASAAPRSEGWFIASGWLLALGSVLFCGDLSLRALAGTRAFPMAAPLGAAFLILGWAQLAVASLKEMTTKPT